MNGTTLELLAADFTRPYNLAPTVDSTIPTQARPGEPGTHWVARGLMAETCAQLLARPVRLQYREHDSAIFISVHVSLASSILTSDPLGTVANVSLIIGQGRGQWALQSGDRMIGTGPHVPSPRQLAGMVAADHHTQRSAATTTCRAPVAQPKPLW